jgi:hypothetical protein
LYWYIIMLHKVGRSKRSSRSAKNKTVYHAKIGQIVYKKPVWFGRIGRIGQIGRIGKLGSAKKHANQQSTTEFLVSYAPTGRAKCKKCKQLIKDGSLRVSREIPNDWTGDKGSATSHYHLAHGMQAIAAVRCTSLPTGSLPLLRKHASLSEKDAQQVDKMFDKAMKAYHKKCN